MTDRFATLTVALERDIREDDAEALISAIKMLRGVLDVRGDVADQAHYVAESRVRLDLERKLRAVLNPATDARSG